MLLKWSVGIVVPLLVVYLDSEPHKLPLDSGVRSVYYLPQVYNSQSLLYTSVLKT